MDAERVASFRMYGALPRAARAWRELFSRVFDDADVAVRVIEHTAPAPIASLWQRADLCCDFMCGWPFVRASPPMQAIAAPVPAPPRYEGLPRYCSEFLVRADDGWRTIEQTFGHRIGWMSQDSQSGFNAPRAFLASFVSAQRPRLYAESRGPLGGPLQALQALSSREVDVVALDSYFLDLCRHFEPERLAGMRAVATTPWTPIPLLVAAPAVESAVVARLAERLTSIDRDASYAPLLANVLVQRFVTPDVVAYGILDRMADDAAARGYATIR